MIRLLGFFGTLERDMDVIVVADTYAEAEEAISTFLVPVKGVDLHVLTTDEFVELVKEEPFYANVYFNGDFVLKNLSVKISLDRIREKARERFIEQCTEGIANAGLAYYYLISKGIFPRNRDDVRRILKIDPKTKGVMRLCQGV
ncbi:hypothetical protein L3N51_01626 [Metallosphaera sp. J1]|uniref:hypothetical protein n=1 Tax=Metallosphaera javensis (ex Hofmann et al. 2022) TaxID=99938 RepID=UPI001EDDDA7E|nr:hypothetical protein [Metallosphaera javensis (ex Hofmann et al. 2022)]MCG3109336.1 hypothetical protein [Metallosphaera javensis (ex Hofmann et al. 2022)]